MAEQGKHGISWCTTTWNPVRGCSRVSRGCEHCYAERVAARFSAPGQSYHGLARLVGIGHDDKTGEVLKTRAQWTGDVAFVKEHLEDPIRWKKPRMVFVNSMSDLFHEGIPDEWIEKIWQVMETATQHTFQVLTKRPERMLKFCHRMLAEGRGILLNVWWGVSAEDQKTFDHRAILLKQTPAAVRWLSLEPLLGPIDLTKVTAGKIYRAKAGEVEPLNYSAFWEGTVFFDECDIELHKIDWVVVGGESGPEARPMHPEWARNLRDQCVANKVPFFFKQWGEWLPGAGNGFTQWPEIKPPRPVLMAEHPGQQGFDNHQVMVWIGKKKAGDQLDGRQWREFPEVRNGR